MKNLFIDSNVWLSLYHFTNDDLTQFGKLKELNGKTVQLYIPQQVYDEVYRNREARLKDSLKQFEIKDIHFPAFCKSYDEYTEISKNYKNLKKSMSQWLDIINKDIREKNLSADRTIKEIFDKTNLIECESLLEKAYSRYKFGNPPGKNDKYGDAINWECLLKAVPDSEDLYLISADKDYCSEIDIDRLNPFLEDEWRNKKNSNIYFYTNLVSFLTEHIKEINLETEQEKQNLIGKLKNSESFEETHGIIAMLNKHIGWTNAQIEDICEAAEENTQIKWIIEDQDVYEFYYKILSKLDPLVLPKGSTKTVYEWIINVIPNGTQSDNQEEIIPSL